LGKWGGGVLPGPVELDHLQKGEHQSKSCDPIRGKCWEGGINLFTKSVGLGTSWVLELKKKRKLTLQGRKEKAENGKRRWNELVYCMGAVVGW